MRESLTREELGERLRIARVNSALTQQVAANAMSMSRTTIVAIEAGQRRLSAEEIGSFASLYSISVGRLVGADTIHVDLSVKFRRQNTGEEGSSIAQAIDLFNRLATGTVELERALGVTFKTDYPPPINLNPKHALRQAEDAAISLRNRLGLGLGRLGDALGSLEFDLGIRIFTRPLSDGRISGLYAFDPEIGACVLLNGNHPEIRRRQSLVHEIGHFISDRSHADVLVGEPASQSVEERFARRFGPAFLMPAPTIRTRVEQILAATNELTVREMILMARQFDVTTEAMCRRLEDLDLVASGAWEYLKDGGYSSKLEIEVAGPKPAARSIELIPSNTAYLASRALEDGILSETQLCEMLIVNRDQLRRILGEFMGADRLFDGN